ncbi:uncharacterized protein [Rutidosis leptorrhynchoides]|uniref:uncharacterized protein n=1 Tax=Rutidosis leptorrhynchoides TaxID=125765 RepID=UPI003A9962FE
MAFARTFLFTIVIITLLHPFDAVPSKFVKDFCGGQNNPHACLSAITPDPKSTTVSNYHDLALIIFKLAVSNTTNSRNFLISSKGKYKYPRLINGCINAFRYSRNSFNSAFGEVDEDPQTCSYDAFVAKDGAEECESYFKHAGIKIPPEISIRAGYIVLYSVIGQNVADHL